MNIEKFVFVQISSTTGCEASWATFPRQCGKPMGLRICASNGSLNSVRDQIMTSQEYTKVENIVDSTSYFETCKSPNNFNSYNIFSPFTSLKTWCSGTKFSILRRCDRLCLISKWLKRSYRYCEYNDEEKCHCCFPRIPPLSVRRFFWYNSKNTAHIFPANRC